MALFRKHNVKVIEAFKEALDNKIVDDKLFHEELSKLFTLIQNSNLTTNRKLNLYDLISKSRNSKGKVREIYLKKLKSSL